MLRHVRAIAILVLLAGAVGSCATQTQLTSQWKDPSFTGAPGQKVAVVAVTGSERNTMIWESSMSTALQSAGAVPVAGSTMFPNTWSGQRPDSATLVNTINQTGVQLVMVSRLMAVNQVQTYVPGTVTYGYYGYYSGGMAVVGTPGYYETDTEVVLETNVFDVYTQKLVWSAASSTLDPSNANDAASSISNAVVQNMVATGVLPAPKKK